MDKKIFALPLMVAFSLLFSMSFAMAAITFITPSTAGDTVTGTYTFNITTAVNATDELYFCNLSTTANAQFNSSSNTTAKTYLGFAFTMSTAGLTDAEDTTLTVNCSNSTYSEKATLTINVDNTAPVCAFTIDKDIVEYLDGIGIETTQSSTDTTDLTYAWVLYRGDNTQSTTSTSAAPTFDDGNFDQIDEFTLALTVTDEASLSTACTNKTIMVTGTNGDDDLSNIASVTSTWGQMYEENKMMIIGGGVFLLLLIVAIVVILMIGKTKKGGR